MTHRARGLSTVFGGYQRKGFFDGGTP
jgi:hypothetical protein